MKLSRIALILAGAILCATAPEWTEVARGQFKDALKGGFPEPTGQIAFVRDRDLWLMEADGSNPRSHLVSGRIANKLVWSPDNQEILYCQLGMQQYQLPNGGGGTVKLYDVFAVRASNAKSVKQVTSDAMSSSPDYFPDGARMAFTRNLNAMDLSAEFPLYQVFVGGIHGKPEAVNLNQGRLSTQLQLMTPSVSPDGKTIACAISTEIQMMSANSSMGIVFFPSTGFKGTVLEWQTKAKIIGGGASPVWSPDGRYVAFVDQSTNTRSLALWDIEREVKRTVYQPLTLFGLTTVPPSWSPDGNWIIFANVKGNIMIVDRQGNNLRSLTRGGVDAYPAFSN